MELPGAASLPEGLPWSAAERRWLRQRLRRWFRRQRRDLPWRQTRDPYAIWVSEIMLQQTQVATVIPYYQRFLQAFPTVAALAAASEEEVLRLWEGLGYYQRARHLHRAAQQIVAEHGGCIPQEPEVFARLPGVGSYTLGAVLSQAFDCRLPILEANSQRLLSRLLGLRADPRQGPVRRWLWQRVTELLPYRGVGEFNQALMELGSLVCTPTAPRCNACPVRRACRAHQLGLQEEIPPPAPPPRWQRLEEVAVVIWRRHQVLLCRRPPQGRWAGLWEFPHGPRAGEEPAQAAQRLAHTYTGLTVHPLAELLTLRHGVTRFRITLTCLEARYLSGQFNSPFYPEGRWLSPAELVHLPVSAPQRRLAQALLQKEK